jgi:formate dehydrogenase major subunit
MTRRTPNGQLVTEDILYIHPDDAGKKGISDNDSVSIYSSRGRTVMKARISDVVKPGVVYTTFHFPEASINYLTSGIADEFTLTPEYKVVAVNFERSLFRHFSDPGCAKQ